MLLERLEGGASVLGFFRLRRGVLLAILGHILTYVIILVEFRMQQ